MHFPSISSQDSILPVPMPTLPAELITEILLKLPVKSLLKFKCVSISWLSLISSPQFVKTHLLLSVDDKNFTHHEVMFIVDDGVKFCSVRGLLYDSITEAFDLDHPGKNPIGDPWIVGSVHGLICLSVGHCEEVSNLFLWNPSIRKFKKLPKCYGIDTSHRYHDGELFDYNFGFAYDEFQDDYKVLGIFTIFTADLSCHFEVKIYSLKSNSWRCLDDFQGKELLDESGKVLNGKLHWLDIDRIIVSIDLVDEKWAELERPCCLKECRDLKLGVLRSDLSLCCNYVSSHVDVWVMKEYGKKESWTKMFTIKTPFDYMERKFGLPIVTSKEGEILLKHGSRLVKYNPKDDSIRYLDITNFALCFGRQIYVKSLVCPF